MCCGDLHSVCGWMVYFVLGANLRGDKCVLSLFRSSPRPDPVRLSSNDNGLRTGDKAQEWCTSSLHFPCTPETYWGISLVSSFHFTSSTWKIILCFSPLCQILQLLTCFPVFPLALLLKFSVLHPQVHWCLEFNAVFQWTSVFFFNPHQFVHSARNWHNKK